MEMVAVPLAFTPQWPKHPCLGARGRTRVTEKRSPAIHVALVAAALNPKGIQQVFGVVAHRGDAVDVAEEWPKI